MYWLPLLLAEGEQGGPPPLLGNPMFPMMILVGIFFIFMMRSSSRQRKEAANMLSKLKKNDKVITSAGIIGVVVALKENEDEVTLRVDESTGSRIRVLKSTIVRVASDEQPQTAPTGETKTP